MGMPATEPGQRRWQAGSDTPRQARSPGGILGTETRRPPDTTVTRRPPNTEGPASPLGPTPNRQDADPKLLSTKHAGPAAGRLQRLATWPQCKSSRSTG